jgi:hypothetical protein
MWAKRITMELDCSRFVYFILCSESLNLEQFEPRDCCNVTSSSHPTAVGWPKDWKN